MSTKSIQLCKCDKCQEEGEHIEKKLHHQINLVMNRLDEQQRRWYAAVEAKIPSVQQLPYVTIQRVLPSGTLSSTACSSQISRTWAGSPLTSYDILLDGLRSTKTETGLRVQASSFDKIYQKGLSVTDTKMNLLLLQKHVTCPNWNYTIRPRIGN